MTVWCQQGALSRHSCIGHTSRSTKAQSVHFRGSKPIAVTPLGMTEFAHQSRHYSACFCGQGCARHPPVTPTRATLSQSRDLSSGGLRKSRDTPTCLPQHAPRSFQPQLGTCSSSRFHLFLLFFSFRAHLFARVCIHFEWMSNSPGSPNLVTRNYFV